MFKRAFEAVCEAPVDDPLEDGWLDDEEVAIALKGVNNNLTLDEERFLYRIIEITGYSVRHGADFKLFSLLAALSHRITALDDWMRMTISDKNFIKDDFKL